MSPLDIVCRNRYNQSREKTLGWKRSPETPKELDREGCLGNTGLHFNESCIVGGDVSGIAMRSRKPLECGGLTPPLWRYSTISLRLKGGVKAPFGRKAVPYLLGTREGGLSALTGEFCLNLLRRKKHRYTCHKPLLLRLEAEKPAVGAIALH
jgi:hypothetical protein